MAQFTEKDVQATEQENQPLIKPAHALSHKDVICQLHSSIEGLSESDIQPRIAKYDRNELGTGEGVQPFKIFLRQVANPMTLVLILAMAVSFGIQSWIEGGVITAVICINIVVGFFQEYNAEKTIDSLRSLSSPTAHTVRSGNVVTVSTAEIVPGDIVVIKVGDTIPADIRLLEAVNLETDEALLTGESLPVRKDAEEIFPADTGPGDRLNVAYSSSSVTKGRATGVVYATGMQTEIGRIAAALHKKDSKRRPVKRKPDGKAKPHRYAQAYALTTTDAIGRFLGVNVGTPLQQKLSKLAVLLFVIAVICAIICLAANQFSSKKEVVIYAVATGLSMIPASLIVVLTITMAAGTKRMVKRHVIVRNLKSLEALGAVTNICSDKTGTLTQGKMVARQAWIPAKGTYSVQPSNEPFNPNTGGMSFSPSPPKDLKDSKDDESIETLEELQNNSNLEEWLKVASFANLATLHKTEEGWKTRGDPTEVAIQVFTHRFNHGREQFVSQPNPAWEEICEFPFDSDVKKMTIVMKNTSQGTYHVFTKGAVECVIDSCVTMTGKDETVTMTEEIQKNIIANMEALAAMGLRVLAFASYELEGDVELELEGKNEPDRKVFERDLVFRGLVGLYDPPRLESAQSVRQCQKAGISVHMLTGDHPTTARAIAIEVGILPSNQKMQHVRKDMADTMVTTAGQFDKLSDDEIDLLPILPLVIARCTPSTKVRMIEALHRRQRFVAMTGDGVNDSPSLKRADVGIAMGQTGSDVAKDASDIVLTDDNFASILNAVEEGRRMFDNIQKFILHVLAENIAQACTLLIGLAFKDADGFSVFPLAPVQILWIIMVTSGMPDMGLGFEEKAPDIMSRAPVNLKRGVFSLEVMLDMVVYGFWTAALCLCSFVLVVWGFGDGDLGQDCNNTFENEAGEPNCETVFRARATCFACLTWFALFLAWEMVSMRRSFFHMQPGSKRYFTQWAIDVWRNKFLFWSIMAGFITVFPVLYIPVINHVVFKHSGIGWEWGIVFTESILFFLGIESWKWAKRVYFRRQASKNSPTGDVDWESKVFSPFLNNNHNDSYHGEVNNTTEEAMVEKSQ